MMEMSIKIPFSKRGSIFTFLVLLSTHFVFANLLQESDDSDIKNKEQTDKISTTDSFHNNQSVFYIATGTTMISDGKISLTLSLPDQAQKSNGIKTLSKKITKRNKKAKNTWRKKTDLPIETAKAPILYIPLHSATVFKFLKLNNCFAAISVEIGKDFKNLILGSKLQKKSFLAYYQKNLKMISSKFDFYSLPILSFSTRPPPQEIS